MPTYNYTALKNGRESVNGQIEAGSIKDARTELKKRGLIPVSVKEQAFSFKKLQDLFNSESRQSLSMREKIDFTNNLHILSKTGVSIVEALFFMQVNSASKNVQALSTDLRKQILSGLSLSDAMARYPKIFDNIFTGLIKTGEESGELDNTLKRMSQLLEKQEKLSSEAKATMMYPIFVIIVAGLVTLVMLVFVFPAFKDMYDDMGQELPWITQTLMDIGTFLKTYWFTIPIGIGSIIYGVIFLLNWEPSKRIIDAFVLKVPILETFVRYISLSNFLAVLKLAFDAGVPVVNSVVLANLTITNYSIRDLIKNAAVKIQYGKSLSDSLKASNAIPKIIMTMISTGEQSGNLGEMLKIATEYVDTELERVISTLNKVFEPILLVVIGSIVLILALALYLPLFQSYSEMM